MLTEGPNVNITGAGTNKDPYIISAEATPGGSGGRLTGEIIAYGGSIAPPGWLIANGQSVSRVTYNALFAVLGETYGAGDGVNTFTVPDLAGRFPLGADVGYLPGSTGGAMSVTLGVLNLPAHAHTITHTHSIAHDHPEQATAQDGAHGHPALLSNDETGPGANRYQAAGSSGAYSSTALLGTTNGSHRHQFNIPAFSGNSGASSAADSGSVGQGQAFGILPPFTAVTFLVKT